MLIEAISEDSVLVMSLKGADEDAFTEIYEKYHKQLYYIALSYLKDPCAAEDTVQEIFMKLWFFKGNLKETLSLKCFLYTSLRNLSLNTIRNNNTKIAKYQQLSTRSEKSRNLVEEAVVISEYQDIVEKGIRKLSPAKQKIFRLRSIEGMNNKEVSEQLGLSINTVKFQFSNASKFLRDYLKQNADLSN
ncbi:RNA polymerase sigma factor [Pararhodonellum marinum]|uniref:RNA polymerase sigma factor n=1 Tax=Pararhodonellum marinum TaxID=2755358 RepID=UPI00188DDCC5|nr:RNA polymerase sigma-70 factor [Pararhodonellum marinum]